MVGRAYEGVQLPCIYPDTSAAARHATGLLSSRGYRELVYLRLDVTSRGDVLAAEAVEVEARQPGLNPRVAISASTVTDVRRVLTELFASRPKPNGILMAHGGFCVTVLGHLLAAGFRIPAEVALICVWDDIALDYTVPTFARYSIDAVQMGRKTATMLLDVIRRGRGKLRSVEVLPQFVPGETVSAAINQ